MFHAKEVKELLPGITPFPENIFTDDQPWLANHLLPLLSIDLGILRDELSGTVVHVICPVEPYDGYIGEGTTSFHNEFTSPNWFAFQLTDSNRYRFLGSERYFLTNKGEFDSKHEALMRESYAKSHDYFEKNGRLASYSMYGSGEAHENSWLNNLGGDFENGNWIYGAEVPSAFRLTGKLVGEKIEITYQGNSFFHVADVAGYNYCATGADSILVFYEPKSRIVLFTFDWS